MSGAQIGKATPMSRTRPELVPDLAPDTASGPANEEVATPGADEAPETFAPTTPSTPTNTATPPAPQAVDSAAKVAGSKSNRLLVAGLVIALVLTGLALFDQTRKVTQLAGEVAVLEAEVAMAASEVQAYETRFQQVRGAVGELVSRVGQLSSLVAGDVLPATLSDVAGDGAPEPVLTE
jgi:outer membrane murein-binding lipoprotein Lpp